MKSSGSPVQESFGIHRLGVITFPDSLLFVLSMLIPVTYLTVRNPDLLGVLAVAMLLTSLFVLWRERSIADQIGAIDKLHLILLSLALPTVALLIVGSLRLDFYLPEFDGPSRMLLVIPVFLALYVRQIDFSKATLLALPLGLITIFVYAITHNQGLGDRLTVKHMNPILWGDSAMVLGMMSLYSIRSTDSIIKKAYLVMGSVVGVLMSILSQSRGGWVAGCVLLLVWGWIHHKSIPTRWVVVGSISCAIAGIGLYQYSGIVHQRVDGAFSGVYGWLTGRNTQTSPGYRLTMWKIGLYLFMKHPLLGYGHGGLQSHLSSPYIRSFANPVAIHGIVCCGPHNEIIAQLLRSGIFGLLSLSGTYFIPLFYFGTVFFESGKTSVAASQALCLIIGFFVSALTIEMLTLKVAWTFYALFMVGLMSSAELRRRDWMVSENKYGQNDEGPLMRVNAP
ncbi:MAG: O-antigen ligase family protein [Acidiferrobacteraceae bacterium]